MSLTASSSADAARRGPSPALWLALVLVFHVLVHVRYVGLPPVGFHLWRQADTYAVARGYAEETLDLMTPRVDARGAGPGIVGMEFPIVPWLVGVGWRLVGPNPAVARGVVLALSVLTLLACYRFTRIALGSSRAGVTGALLLAVSPLFAYYAVTLLPDVPMLAPLYLGMAAWLEWAREPRARHAWIGSLGLAAAALLKLSSAAAWPAAVVLLVQGLRRATWSRRLIAALAGLGCAAIVLAWYLHARDLNARYGLPVFKLDSSFPYPLATVRHVVPKLLVQWLPELFLNYASFVLFVCGVAWLGRVLRSSSDVVESPRGTAPPALGRGVLLAWAAGAIAYVVAFLPMLHIHDYYIVGLLPLLVLVATIGWTALERRGGTLARRASFALLAAGMVLGPFRGLSRLEGVHPPEDLATLAPVVDRLVPDRSTLVIAANDPSPSIYLWFLHRHGWSVTDRVSVRDLERMTLEGARVLVSDSRELENRSDIAPRLDEVGRHGRFRVFRLTGSRW